MMRKKGNYGKYYPLITYLQYKSKLLGKDIEQIVVPFRGIF
jgi:hypothetical protein